MLRVLALANLWVWLAVLVVLTGLLATAAGGVLLLFVLIVGVVADAISPAVEFRGWPWLGIWGGFSGQFLLPAAVLIYVKRIDFWPKVGRRLNQFWEGEAAPRICGNKYDFFRTCGTVLPSGGRICPSCGADIGPPS